VAVRKATLRKGSLTLAVSDPDQVMALAGSGRPVRRPSSAEAGPRRAHLRSGQTACRSARLIKQVAAEVFQVTGRNPKLDIATELEKTAVSGDYFIPRKLYPNVDFYSGIIYQAIGFTPDQVTVLFGIPRSVGWRAQSQEMLPDGDKRSPARARSMSAKKSANSCRSPSAAGPG
jgi:hypothetical protein